MAFADQRQIGWVTVETGVITERDSDTVRAPDVAYWSRERLPELPNKFTDVVPDLAVEVVSPGDTYQQVSEKVFHYLEHGVRMVWLVEPELRTVTIYRSLQEARVLRQSDEIDGADVLPGFKCVVSEFFDA